MHLFTRTTGATLAGLTTIAALAVPMSTQAATPPAPRATVSSTASGGMTYVGTDANNNIKITLTGTKYTIDDTVEIQANSGCALVAGDATKVTCTAFKLPDGSFKRFNVFARDGRDTVTNATAVAMTAHGDDGQDTLVGGAADDRLFGDLGDFDSVDGGPGADVLSGGVGIHDLALYSSRTSRVTVNLNGGADSQPDGEPNENDQVDSSAEDIIGGKGADQLFGNSADNILVGGSGNDILVGFTGADALVGGDDSDVLVSNEELFGGPLEDGAVDILRGGNRGGFDACSGSGADGDQISQCEQ